MWQLWLKGVSFRSVAQNTYSNCRMVCLERLATYASSNFSSHIPRIFAGKARQLDVYWTVHHCDSNKKTTIYLLHFLDTPHVSGIDMAIFRSLRLCCWTTTLAVLFLDCCVLDLGCGSARVVSGLPVEASAGSPDTTLAEPHPKSNTQQSKNNTADVVAQQHSRKLLKMDIWMPETLWLSKK